MRRISLVLLSTAFFAATLAGCSIYRMDVAQGNIVTQDMVDQLRVGMTRSQVRFVLGTPLVSDPFHRDRWDYFYSLHKGVEKTTETQVVTVVFKGDSLASIEGTAKPTLETGRPIVIN
jgi:outer membrane protein assembly factor BamE